MRRFYIDNPVIWDGCLELAGAEARHINTVLRMRPGERLELFDGQGQVYAALLERVTSSKVLARITAVHQKITTDRWPLTLAQCLLKGAKMDLLVQKATELGVTEFLPIVSRYCENHGKRERQEERWHRIMLEACKQSLRTVPMRITPVQTLDEVDFARFSYRMVAWEKASQALATDFCQREPRAICLLLGPEGGLAEVDLDILDKANFLRFSLGPRILRGETASLAATAIVQYCTGNLKPQTPAP